MDNNLRLLGLTKKAGMLAIGDESVYTQARCGNARAIFSAADASDASKRRARRYAEEFRAVYAALPYTKTELGAVVGRGSPGMLASLDTGLASRLLSGLAGSDPEGYSETAELLAFRAQRRRRRRKKDAQDGKNIGNRKRRAE